jgi:hypothetical protein
MRRLNRSAELSRQQRRQRAREERKREEAQVESRKRKRRGWILVGVAVAIGVVCVVSAATLAREYATQVTGRLAGVRELSFVEGTQDNGGISPVCGCEKPPVNAWRGITFAARGVRLDRRGGLPWTRWTVSPAEPDSVVPMGSLQRLRVVAVRIDPDGTFDPRWMLDSDIAKHGQVLGKTSFRGSAFSFYTHHDLRLGMLSPVPVGAWVPFPGSKVSLTSLRSEFFAENVNSRIDERYPASIGVHSRPGRRGLWESEPQVVPLGDFLGPNLVLWTEDPAARLFGTSFDTHTRPGVVTAILIGDSNFSTRIAVTPADWIDVAETAVEAAKYPRRTRENLYFRDLPSGRLRLTVERALGQRQYEALKRRVAAHPRTWVQLKLPPEELDLGHGKFGLPSNVATARRVRTWSQEERYPPLPHYSGLNIFGPLRQVGFEGVHGHLMIADRDIPLGGSATVELDDVHGLQDDDGHQLISSPLATARQSAELQFEAAGTARVNGVLQTTERSHLEPKLAGFGLALAIVAPLIGIAASLWRFRRREDEA